MRTINQSVMALCVLGMLGASSASAVGLGYGFKLGAGTVISEDALFDSAETISAFAGVFTVELPVFSLETDLMYVHEHFGVAALVRAGMPLVPTVLDVDCGIGVDYRLNAGHKQSLIMLPMSVQFSGSLAVMKLYGELRFNYLLAGTGDHEIKSKTHEFLLLGGVTF